MFTKIVTQNLFSIEFVVGKVYYASVENDMHWNVENDMQNLSHFLIIFGTSFLNENALKLISEKSF